MDFVCSISDLDAGIKRMVEIRNQMMVSGEINTGGDKSVDAQFNKDVVDFTNKVYDMYLNLRRKVAPYGSGELLKKLSRMRLDIERDIKKEMKWE